MPDMKDEFPLFYNQKEKAYLDGSPFVDLLKQHQDMARGDYQMICSSIPQFTKFSYQMFLEAICLVNSRGYSVKLEQQEVRRQGFFTQLAT